MRILSLEEVESLPLEAGYRVVLLPDEYGKFLHVWFRWDEDSHGRLGREEWCGRVECLPFKRRLFPMTGTLTDGYFCMRFKSSILVSSIDAGFERRRIPGCLYLRLDEMSRGRDWEARAADERMKQFEEVLGGRVLEEYSDRNSWLVETWFEPPPGYVWETARFMERELGASHPFTRDFRRLVYEEDPTSRANWEKRLAAEDAKCSKRGRGRLVRPPVVGPDLTWRFSVNPWWVQSILLARLMGGARWSYVWGALEALHGKVTDWTLLGTSNGTESSRESQG